MTASKELAQRQLEKARIVRTQRKVLRQKVHKGEMQVAELLVPELHPAVSSMTVEGLFCWIPRVGPSKARLLVRLVLPRDNMRLSELADKPNVRNALAKLTRLARR